MKKKVLISIVGIALFAVAIGFGTQREENSDLLIQNREALEQAEAGDIHCSDVILCSTDNAVCTMCDDGGMHTTSGYDEDVAVVEGDIVKM